MSSIYSASGILQYFNLLDPINLIDGPISRDIQSWLKEVQKNLCNKRVAWEIKVSTHFILAEADPEDSGEDNPLTLTIGNIPDAATILNTKNGFTNLSAYLNTVLESMNGQLVHFNCTPTSFTIVSDADQKLNELWRDPDVRGNDILIEDGKERTVCGIGKGPNECCIFPTVSRNGFECTKFSSTGSYMLDRLKKGDTNAKRIGNCRVLGYKKKDETVS